MKPSLSIGLPLAVVLLLVAQASGVFHSPALAEEAVSRIRPLPAEEWSPDVQRMLGATRDRVAALEGAEPTAEPKTLNILRTIAHHPKLLGPFLEFATVLGQNGSLARRDSEILALRASWNCQSEFEWGHHVEYARAAGLTDVEIERVSQGPSALGWSPQDQALLLAADQLHAHQQIDDDVWRQLAARYSETQLVEIPFVVGQYTMLSMVANSTGVELEDGYDRLPVKK